MLSYVLILCLSFLTHAVFRLLDGLRHGSSRGEDQIHQVLRLGGKVDRAIHGGTEERARLDH